MELRDYLDVVRKRWLSILVTTVAGTLVAVAATFLTTPVYTATTQLYVSVQGGQSTSDLVQGSTFTRQQVTSYMNMVDSPLVLGPVIDGLGLDERAEDLADRVSAESPVNSSLIDIAVGDENGAIAATTANAIAEQFTDVIEDLETPTGGGASPVKISVVRQAVEPAAPSSPNTTTNVTLGLLVGLALGVGVAMLREVLDTRVRTEADVARLTPTSVIGSIPFDDEAATSPLIVHSSSRSARAESFRRLRTNVQFLDVDDRPQSIVVTSSLPGEGKSSTTINLALALADAGTRVALVDADLRRPAVARYLGLEGAVGLTTVLIGRASIEDVIQPWGDGNLHVLPSGQVPPNPSELLGSHAMAHLLDTLTERYDVVLVDTPPLLPVTDAAILSKLTRGAVLVVGADRLHRGQLAEAVGALHTVDARVLGIVVNRVARKQGDAYTYYEYAEAEGRPTRRRRGGQKPPADESRPVRGTGSRRSRGSAAARARADVLAVVPGPDADGGGSWPAGPIGPGKGDGRP